MTLGSEGEVIGSLLHGKRRPSNGPSYYSAVHHSRIWNVTSDDGIGRLNNWE